MEQVNFGKKETKSNYSISKGRFDKDCKNIYNNLVESQRKLKQERIKNFNGSNLKVKKSIMLSSPVFSVKYSYFRPNILCACEENGILSIIDTQAEKKRTNNNVNNNNDLNQEFNNTLQYHEIEPKWKYQAHNNSIFDFDWCFSDNKILTASGDMSSQLINLEDGSNIINEMMLIGHTKSIKTVKQAFYDDNIIATCGRDGMIFIWDLRTNNKKFCKKNCDTFKIPHIHPIGGFKSMNKTNGTLKRKSTHGNLINEDCNTFTGINFFSRELIVSIETNEDDLKFWDIRKMLDEELEYFLTIPDKPNQKLTKKQLNKLEEKENFVANCNQYSHIYMRYVELQEANKMSSKHNSSKNLLFNNLPSNLQNKTTKVVDLMKLNSGYSYSNKKLDSYQFISSPNIINKDSSNLSKISNISSKIKYGINFVNKQNVHDINREVLDLESVDKNSIIKSNNILFNDREYEEEKRLKNMIKEIASKKNVKGLTSLYINRENRKILVNSMSHSQFIYDCLYWDKKTPIELRGHKSSYCVKSVLSPNADYVLSGSSDANIYIWNIENNFNNFNNEPIKLTGFHSLEVGAVDWGRNYDNFIASACDNGLVLIWDDK